MSVGESISELPCQTLDVRGLVFACKCTLQSPQPMVHTIEMRTHMAVGTDRVAMAAENIRRKLEDI